LLCTKFKNTPTCLLSIIVYSKTFYYFSEQMYAYDLIIAKVLDHF